MRSSRYLSILGFVAVVIAVQILTQVGGKEFFLSQLTMAAYYSLVVLGLGLLMGFAGQISLGHAAFFAIGGYTSAVLTTLDLRPQRAKAFVSVLAKLGIIHARPDLYGGTVLTVQPWAAFIIAILLTVVIAFMIGVPVLKLRGHYLAMATLGFGTIIYSIVLATQQFGAADGISNVPPFQLLPGLSVSGASGARVQTYYIAWGLVAVTMMLLINLIDSRVGRALRSIHSAEDAANTMGINTARYKLNVFVLSAVLAAIGGVFLTHFNGGIGPSEASIMKSVRYVAIVAVGGMASLWGTLLMSAILNFLSLRGYFGIFDDAVFGGILILIMLFSPEGILRFNLIAVAKQFLKRSHSSEETS
ncbi:MAG TPA: branched-chain amino acid ABC transporter permease [Nitrospiraceae bacterium]|jgi:branched-chain amino acid transport system permease protein|nr:branched-chain amino acid ABC transporter permease [Nitrospiraceae bacterium]